MNRRIVVGITLAALVVIAVAIFASLGPQTGPAVTTATPDPQTEPAGQQ